MQLVEPTVTPLHRIGSGTPLLLLHGITGTWRMWEPLLPYLAKLPGAELIKQKGVGHVPMSDEPELVSRLITEVTGAVDRAAVQSAERG